MITSFYGKDKNYQYRLGLVPEYHIPIHFYIRRRSYSYATKLAVARYDGTRLAVARQVPLYRFFYERRMRS